MTVDTDSLRQLDAALLEAHLDPGLLRLAALVTALRSVDGLALPELWAAVPPVRLARLLETGAEAAVRERLFAVDPSGSLLMALEGLPQSWWSRRERVTVIISGFTPFGEHLENPSWDVALAMATVLGQTYRIKTERVPVNYAVAESFGAEQLSQVEQGLLVHIGLAASAGSLRLEYFAHNRRQVDAPLCPAGPDALATCLALADLGAAFNRSHSSGLNAVVSADAGDYVCNAIYYHSLLSVRRRRHADGCGEALMIHVPPVDGERARAIGYDLGESLASLLAE